jgi:hypothetical protein
VTESRTALERSSHQTATRRRAQSALGAIGQEEDHSNETKAPIAQAREGLDQAETLLARAETGAVDVTEIIDESRSAVGLTDDISSRHRHDHEEDISEETKAVIRAFIANTEDLGITLNLPEDDTRPNRVQDLIARSRKSIEEAREVLDEIGAEYSVSSKRPRCRGQCRCGLVSSLGGVGYNG